MTVIAAGLGNSEVICAKHYAHLCPTYIGGSLRAGFGTLGIVPPETKVVTLRYKTHALELKGEVYSQLRAICQQTGWTIGQAVAEALKLLQADVAAEARSARTAEIYNHAVEEKRKSDEATVLRRPSKLRKPKPPVQPEEADGQVAFCSGSLYQIA